MQQTRESATPDVPAIAADRLRPPCAACEPASTLSVALSPLDRLDGRPPRALCARHHLAELFELLERARELEARDGLS